MVFRENRIPTKHFLLLPMYSSASNLINALRPVIPLKACRAGDGMHIQEILPSHLLMGCWTLAPDVQLSNEAAMDLR